ADITTATAIEEVHLEDLLVREVAGSADSLRYRLVLTQHVAPPAPSPGPLGDLADLVDLEAGLALEALALLDILQVPDLLATLPELSDPTPPLRDSLAGVESALAQVDG